MHRSIRAAVCVAALTLSAPAAAHAAANDTDRAFVREMAPHHQMAIQMAAMAKTDGGHRQIRVLAAQIIKAQTSEIRTLRSIAKSLSVTPEKMPENGTMSDTMMRDFDTLGVSAESSGMSMDMHELHHAKPFDKAFIDMMIPHHAGAIRMARAERAKGTDSRLRKIASAIIRDQAKEIRRMNAWRKAWFGKSSPAGGVPTA